MSRFPPLAAIFGFSGQALTAVERVFFKRVRPTGYILFTRNIDNAVQLSNLIRDLKDLTSGYKVLILIDQEGGRVQRLKPPYWRAAPAMADFGVAYTRDADKAAMDLRLNMRLIGQELCALGIDVNCAPVMDVPVPGAHDVIGDRAFSKNPSIVSALAVPACEGLVDAGVLPVIKHIPGHGRANSDSHHGLPVVDADLSTLKATDFLPFRQFCSNADRPPCLAMTAHVIYRSIDALRPATTSPRVMPMRRRVCSS